MASVVTAANAAPPVGVSVTVAPAMAPPAARVTTPLTVPVVAAGHVTETLSVTVPPAATPVYGNTPGLVHPAGSAPTAMLPPPTATLLIVYAPWASVVTAGSAAPPVGVSVMVAPAITAPPAARVTTPLTVPVVAVGQVTVTFLVTVPPAVTPVYDCGPGFVHPDGSPPIAMLPPPTGTLPMVYAPDAFVVTAASAAPPVGVTVIVTPAIGVPPDARVTTPETVPTDAPALVTVTGTSRVPVSPPLSVTVRRTVKLPADAKVWVTVAPVAVPPSPNDQAYDAMDPSGSVEPAPENVTAVPATAADGPLMAAVGA